MKVGSNLTYETLDGWFAPMRHNHLYAALGLDPKAHLPKEGLSKKLIGNVWIWVTPKTDKAQDAGRTRCHCPECGNEFTAGKLRQHMKVHKS